MMGSVQETAAQKWISRMMAADLLQDTEILPRTSCEILSSANLLTENDAHSGANYNH